MTRPETGESDQRKKACEYEAADLGTKAASEPGQCQTLDSAEDGDGKAASRPNALKHGILSRMVDLPSAVPEADLCSLELSRTILPEVLGRAATIKEISRIWGKLVRVVVFERDCIQRPNGLEQNGRLIDRYERMLTRQLHARIREQAGLTGKH
jgi:hypothetical protein